MPVWLPARLCVAPVQRLFGKICSTCAGSSAGRFGVCGVPGTQYPVTVTTARLPYRS